MKLTGLRVIDLSVFLPGPYLTLALADHGAEVIKIEAPGGDPSRSIGLADGPTTVLFHNLNRGKKSVVLDLKTSEGRERLLELSDNADIFVESFRPGVVERLGVGYSHVSARNPGIVYCSVTAFGQTGLYRARPAHDLALQAMSGVLSMNVGPDGAPAMPAIPSADILAGLQGLAGVLMALWRREKTGVGDYIDISMQDAMLAACPNILGPTFAENRQPVAANERTTGGSAFYQLYETRDGRHIALAGQEMKFVRTLLDALGRPELADLCARGPGPHQQPVTQFLRGVFRERTFEEWIAWLTPLDVCFGPLHTLPEAIAEPNVQARGTVVTDESGRRHLATAIRFQREPARPSWREPNLGEHTEDVLRGAPSRKDR